MSGGKLIVGRRLTLAVLRACFFAFRGFRFTGIVCHHFDEIEHKSKFWVKSGSFGETAIGA